MSATRSRVWPSWARRRKCTRTWSRIRRRSSSSIVCASSTGATTSRCRPGGSASRRSPASCRRRRSPRGSRGSRSVAWTGTRSRRRSSRAADRRTSSKGRPRTSSPPAERHDPDAPLFALALTGSPRLHEYFERLRGRPSRHLGRGPRRPGPRRIAASGGDPRRAAAQKAERRAGRPRIGARSRAGADRMSVPLLRWEAPGRTTSFSRPGVGGVSEGPFESLNLGRAPTTSRSTSTRTGAGCARRWARTSRRSRWPPGRTRPSSPGRGRLAGSPGDGLWTDEPGVPMLALGADCVPIALGADDGAGRRSPSSMPAGADCSTGSSTTAAKRSAGLAAVVGPGDRAVLLRGRRGGREPVPRRASATDSSADSNLDLWTAAERALRAAGVAGSTASTSARACDPDLFFSHRRDTGRTGRQGVVALCRLSRSARATRGSAAEVGPGVTIVAATKYVSVEDMAALAEAGIEVVGENRAQDLEAKHAALRRRVPLALHRPPAEPQGEGRERDLRARALARLRVGRASGSRSRRSSRSTSRARRRSRASRPRSSRRFLELYPDVRGLSTMPPLADDPEASRPYFRRLRELAEEHGLRELSMGTSQDYRVAAEEGATMSGSAPCLYRG